MRGFNLNLKRFTLILLIFSVVLVAIAVPAVYAPTVHWWITSSADDNSTISPLGVTQVNNAGSQAYTFSANEGYYISSVLVDGSPVSTTSPYTFTNIVANHTIAVSSSLLAVTWYITASKDAYSAISPSGVVSVIQGDSQGFTFSAFSNYHLTQVLVDGSPVSLTSPYTFSNLDANHTIAVSSTASTLDYTSTYHGVIAFNSTLTSFVINDENATFLNFTASGGGIFHFVIPTSGNASSVYRNGVLQDYGTVWTYDPVNNDIEITSALSTWEITLPPIIPSASPHGGGGGQGNPFQGTTPTTSSSPTTSGLLSVFQVRMIILLVVTILVLVTALGLLLPKRKRRKR
jgi:preprotein translocase subunit SecG